MTDLGSVKAYFIVGPTASGKGSLARGVAARYGMEIISMDSMKVYRSMDVGTAKPSAEDRARVPHHMIDVASPHEVFDLASWVRGAEQALLDMTKRGLRALFCGGTGLYLKGILSGVFEGPPVDPGIRTRLEAEASESGPEALHERLRALDPEAGRRIHPRDVKRIVRALEVIEATGEAISSRQVQFARPRSDLVPCIVGIRRERTELLHRIDLRLDDMMARGFLEEVRRFREGDRPLSRSASQALGYPELSAYLAGKVSLEEAQEAIRRNTRKFVRRQLAWFRRFPNIRWLDVSGAGDDEETMARVADAFSLVPPRQIP